MEEDAIKKKADNFEKMKKSKRASRKKGDEKPLEDKIKKQIHIRDQRERRFVIEYGPDEGGKRNNMAGLVELVEIDHIHRRAEYQIIVAPDHQGKGIATRATELALEYGFSVLNLYKIYLIVDVENAGARHVYEKIGFQAEGTLRHEFFINGQYRDVTRMCLFQHEYLQRALTASP